MPIYIRFRNKEKRFMSMRYKTYKFYYKLADSIIAININRRIEGVGTVIRDQSSSNCLYSARRRIGVKDELRFIK